MKYKIDRSFFPFSLFKPPISEGFLKLAVSHMKPPRRLFRDRELDVKRLEIESYDGERIECFMISQGSISDKAPCLIYLHGGGFVLAAAGYHYKNAIHYAKEAECKVLFVNYRLAPKHAHPVFFEDCYAAVCYAYENADSLGIDVTLNETRGTMHGFDIMQRSRITKAALAARVEFMRSKFQK